MNKLEHDLKAQPRRALPAEWREEILANALADDSTSHPAMLSWLFPQWLRYGVAAVWALSLALHFQTSAIRGDEPSAPITITTDSDHPMKWFLAIQSYHDNHATY